MNATKSTLWRMLRAASETARRERSNREWGVRMRSKRGAKAANAAIRASGRVPGAEGRAAVAASLARWGKKRDEGVRLGLVVSRPLGWYGVRDAHGRRSLARTWLDTLTGTLYDAWGKSIGKRGDDGLVRVDAWAKLRAIAPRPKRVRNASQYWQSRRR